MVRTSSSRRRQIPWTFALPAILLTGLLFLAPSVLGGIYAFTDWDGLTPPLWTGLDNFTEFLSMPQGADVLVHSLVLTVAYVVLVNAAGFVLALGLARKVRTRVVLRALFFLPAVVSPLVVAYIWKYVLDAHGPLNEALRALGLESAAHPWLGQPQTALASVILVMVWQFAGYHMLIYLAGLQAIQREIYEAASVDGASAWHRLRFITLPALRPTLVISTALSTITGLMVFDQVMALTGGGPMETTETLGTYVYKQAFVNGRYGYSAAIALMLVVLVLIIVLVQTRAMRRNRE